MLRLSASLTSDVGVKRTINEDHAAADAAEQLFVVCDGMGGHAGGELASRLATERILAFVSETRRGIAGGLPYPVDPSLHPEANRLAMAVRVANHVVYETQRTTPALSGMGTTVVASALYEGYLYTAHVGDSRLYRLRRGELEALTRDHSALNELIDAGDIRPEDAHQFPDKNVITKALGVAADVVPSVRKDAVLPGDMFVLCSDGLNDLVTDAHIRERCLQSMQLSAAERGDGLSRILVEDANAAGGRDNITVMVLWDAAGR